MVVPIALLGWAAWSVAIVVALLVHRSRAARMEAVTRACHELRGPLTAARLGIELGSRTGELSPARLRAIDLELRRAALAVEDLAAARRNQSARIDATDVELTQLLEDSVEACRVRVARRDVPLRVRWTGAAARVWGDPVRLAQAISNLIVNAIEHGGGTVEVQGRSTQDTVRIEVSDSGPGLPAPVAELASTARGGRGERGRGLAIARSIASDHGGRLAAAPAERGARLVLELPVQGVALRRSRS